jgi:hypothetical protein
MRLTFGGPSIRSALTGSILHALGLQFIGFEWPDAGTPARYRDRFPDDPALTNLDNWHALETDRPDTFVLMYQFWVRKRAAGSAPVP